MAAVFKKHARPSVASVEWTAVAVGTTTGVFTTKEAAADAAGSHPCPLVWGGHPTEDAAAAVVAAFRDADAVLYTDGACSNNGKYGARAGVGVYIGEKHPDNVSRAVRGQPTNIVAELEALQDALAVVASRVALRTARLVVIATDSKYAVDAVMTWVPKWRTGDRWLTAKGEPVKHRQLLTDITDALTVLPNVRMVHVRGHAGIWGNTQADALARAGVPAAPAAPATGMC